VSTLNYAQSANGIINKPISSSLISLGPDQFGDKAEKKGTSIESWQEMEMRLQYMQTQVEEAQAALARKHLQQQELQDRAEKAEADLLDNQQKLYDANVEIKSLKGVVETETKKRKLTEKELHKTQLNLKKTYFILKATQATESSLTAEAQTLIGTLEDVITERNEMHALVVSQRDIESERRKATQQFQEAALTILNSIESSFAMLCTNIDISQSNAVEAATLSHSVGRQYVSETQQLLADIAKNVSCVTNSIRTQLVGEGGIVSGVNVSSESILASLKSASTLFAHGEASFDESSEAMRMRLDECAKTMDERASSIQSSTAQTLQSFEAKVTESRNTIGNLVMRVKSSLQNLAASKAEKTKEMDSLVEQWRDQSLENSRSVLDATSSNCESFKSSIATFQNEMHHHDKITKSLESQRSFADFYGAAHVQSVEQQSTVLNAHREKLAECHNNQTKLRNEVMQSILSSVQSVVTSEIEKLATAQLDHFQLLDKDGADLVATNEKMTESAKQVMENIQSTNQLVSGEASVICNNDLKASEAMKSTQSTLERVIMSSNAQLQLTTDFASKSVAAISDMKQLDTQNPQIVQMVERDGHACSKSLVNTVLKPTCLGVKKTVQSGLDAMAYVNNIVVRNINGGLDDIVVNRKAVATEMAEKIDSANSQLVDMKESVASMAKAGSDAAGVLCDETLLAANDHEQKMVPYYNAELDSRKDKLVSTLTTMTESANSVISDGMSQGAIAKESIQDFAKNKMQCIEPVAPAPVKKACNYSDQLSKTPADEDILKSYNLNGAECDSSVPVAEVACKTDSIALPDIDVSHESIDDENTSTRSSGSAMSIQSPGLKSRDINAQHCDVPANSKSWKHSRLAVSTASTTAGKKNKLPSGLPTPSVSSTASRKKMKM
jgi:hypothetical protein